MSEDLRPKKATERGIRSKQRKPEFTETPNIENCVPSKENGYSEQRMGGNEPHLSNSEKSEPDPAGRNKPDGLCGYPEGG